MKLLLLLLAIISTACTNQALGPRSSFADLTPDEQKLVRETYQSLLEAYREKNFPKVKEKSQVILGLLKDYFDTGAYAEIAERGLKKNTNER